MSDALRIMRAGDRALLLEPADPADLAGLVVAIGVLDLPSLDIEDMVPAAATVLVTLRDGADSGRVEQSLRKAFDRADKSLADKPAESILEIPVRYDGDDLDDVAAMLDRSTAEVIAQHTGCIWRCAFIGFAPGFGYLIPESGSLAVPRRTQSRTTVPAGSVGLAGEYSAVYPRRSPGGWQIIGTTETQMWDLGRDVPNLLHPGSRVRFAQETRP